MLDNLDLDELRQIPRIFYYFRYRLHRHDFHEFCVQDRLRGHYTAKPLYGRLTPEGRVDRSAGYNGDVAALFVPIEAHTVHDASLILTHIDPQRVALATGRRNWPAIRGAAEHGIREMLASSSARRSAPLSTRSKATSRSYPAHKGSALEQADKDNV